MFGKTEFPKINEIIRWTDLFSSFNKVAIISCLSALIGIAIFLLASRHDAMKAPRGVRNLAETGVEFIETEPVRWPAGVVPAVPDDHRIAAGEAIEQSAMIMHSAIDGREPSGGCVHVGVDERRGQRGAADVGQPKVTALVPIGQSRVV